ncbi:MULTISPECIES: phosphatase PAP2 family protein [unclassified Bradyrhizobium]|uniref:phosphatase PAP2 family protein n=1 Tax=unclassified Bradyrhizobium TaxID=2631580 RepID=UPI0028EB928A|nr:MULTISPECIES: phosphatase PAP2 family protein [unclassified Bradyrhizobium]
MFSKETCSPNVEHTTTVDIRQTGAVGGLDLPVDEPQPRGQAVLTTTATSPKRWTSRPNETVHHIAEAGLARLAQIDLALVRLVSICARPSPIRFSAITFSRLGNGGIYVIVLIFVFARLGKGALHVIAIAICTVATLHAFYPSFKRRVGRQRPYKIDRNVPSLLDVLDEHSFPSGHIMTLTATLVPTFYVDPGSAAYGAGVLVAMAWARVASGHHYPTDVIAGAFFAFVTGYPLTVIWFGQ